MAGKPTRPEAALIAQRRTEALQLRMAGVDYLTIGRTLAADPKINVQKVAYPCGYGSESYENGEPPPGHKQLAELAKNDVQRAMRNRRTRAAEAADELRGMQDERLNMLLSRQWRHALEGDPAAIDRVLKIMERQARLNGLDAPVRTEVSGQGGTPIRLEAVLEADRRTAIESIKSFREDKQESLDALQAAGGTLDAAAAELEAGYGQGLDDEEEPEEPADGSLAERIVRQVGEDGLADVTAAIADLMGPGAEVDGPAGS